jgi:tetratricopeptide (TPR) repeat protein
VNRWVHGAAAALLCAAAPAAARAQDALARAERELQAVAARLDAVEEAGRAPPDPFSARAVRSFAAGERRFGTGDLEGATGLLLAALEAEGFRSSTSWSEATWLLAEALRGQGLCGGALARYRELLAAPGAAHAGEAALRALDCAVRLGRHEQAEELLQAARRLGGPPPAEALFQAGKAAWMRRDLPLVERRRLALGHLDQAGPPWELHATYFRGAIRVAEGELGPALAQFERCGAAAAAPGAQTAVKELCALGAARVLGAQGRHREAAAFYGVVPVGSPRFAEAAYEAAYAWLRAGRPDLALRSAAILADFAPDSPLGPQATLLQGHLLQQAGRWGEAVDIYNRVINQYAPVRDEVDAILSLREDPVKDFDDLLGRGEGEAAAVLPSVALRWAAGQGEVGRALSLAGALESARRELARARRAADATEAALDRNWGMGAFPALEDAYLRADVAQTVAVHLEADLAAEGLRILPISPARSELEAARAGFAPLEKAVRALPATPEALEARRRAAFARVAGLTRQVHQLAVMAEGLDEEIAALRAYLDRRRGDLKGQEERPAIVEELRRHREVAAGYRAEVAALRREVEREGDLAGRGLTPAEDRQRIELRDRMGQEQEAAAPARRALAPAARDRAARIDGLRARAAELVGRADRLKRGLLAKARAGAEGLKARVAGERRQIEDAARELDQAQLQAKQLVGAVARRAFGEVRKTFYDLVLQADVGIVDVAWTRKRERVDRIQALSARKDLELKAVDAAGATMPVEAE